MAQRAGLNPTAPSAGIDNRRLGAAWKAHRDATDGIISLGRVTVEDR
jgi:hypothetical protein